MPYQKLPKEPPPGQPGFRQSKKDAPRERNEFMGAIGWIFGVIFLMEAIESAANIRLAMMFGAIGYLCIPPCSRFVEKLFQFQFGLKGKAFLIVVLFIAAMTSVHHKDDAPEIAAATTTTHNDSTHIKDSVLRALAAKPQAKTAVTIASLSPLKKGTSKARTSSLPAKTSTFSKTSVTALVEPANPPAKYAAPPANKPVISQVSTAPMRVNARSFRDKAHYKPALDKSIYLRASFNQPMPASKPEAHKAIATRTTTRSSKTLLAKTSSNKTLSAKNAKTAAFKRSMAANTKHSNTALHTHTIARHPAHTVVAAHHAAAPAHHTSMAAARLAAMPSHKGAVARKAAAHKASVAHKAAIHKASATHHTEATRHKRKHRTAPTKHPVKTINKATASKKTKTTPKKPARHKKPPSPKQKSSPHILRYS